LRCARIRIGNRVHPEQRPVVSACLILHVDLPDRNGLDLQSELVKSGIAMPIVFLTKNAAAQIAKGLGGWCGKRGCVHPIVRGGSALAECAGHPAHNPAVIPR
jgi:hypothetical protein